MFNNEIYDGSSVNGVWGQVDPSAAAAIRNVDAVSLISLQPVGFAAGHERDELGGRPGTSNCNINPTFLEFYIGNAEIMWIFPDK